MTETIEVKAKLIGKAPFSGDDYYHLYLVYTDINGDQSFLRAGPEQSISTNEALPIVSSDAMTDKPNDIHDSDSPWGKIEMNFGKYVKDSVDWDPNAKSIVVSQGPETKAQFEQLKDVMCDVEAANISYAGYSVNSNSVMTYALKQVGITPQLPQGVWAPGHDTPLEHVDNVLMPDPSHGQLCVPEIPNQFVLDEIPPFKHSQNTHTEDTEVLQALADAGLIDLKEDGSIESKEVANTTISSDDSGTEIA